MRSPQSTAVRRRLDQMLLRCCLRCCVSCDIARLMPRSMMSQAPHLTPHTRPFETAPYIALFFEPKLLSTLFAGGR